MTEKLYYFDALPLHPPPEPFESLTSYVIRLGEANGGLRSSTVLASLCFPEQRGNGNKIRAMDDYPSISLDALRCVTGHAENKLLQTTFYHLGKKFGHSTSSYAFHAFLNGSTAVFLRYCPVCLTEHSYYSLVWRFLAVQGCARHSCQLYEVCMHCGQKMPLLAFPARIGICPTCKGDLRQCKPEPLTVQERQEVLASSQEMEFFLSPQPWEKTTDSLAEKLGREFAFLRQTKKLTLETIMQRIGSSSISYALSAIEYGRLKGATFRRYVQYAGTLGIRLRDVFDLVIHRREDDEQLEMLRGIGLPPEEKVLIRVERAIDKLKSLGEKVSVHTVSDIIHMSAVSLYKYPRVKSIFEQILIEEHDELQKQRLIQQEEVFGKVQKAIIELKYLGEPITFSTVGKMIGTSAKIFDYYPQAYTLLKQHLNHSYHREQKSLQREEELLRKVEVAISQARSSGQKVTQTMVAKILGKPLHKLKQYNSIKNLLEQEFGVSKYSHPQKRWTESDDELISQIRAAMQFLEASGQKITQRSVAKIVGKSINGLQRYPRVKVFLHENIGYDRYHIWKFSRTEDEEIITQVQDAIAYLVANGQRVTKKAIGKKLGKNPSFLKEHPQVAALLDEIRNKERQRKEDTLLINIKAVIKDLENNGQKVTQRSISRMLGVRPNSEYFHQYPKVIAFLQKIVREKKQQAFSERFQLREEELLGQVTEAVQNLQISGRPITHRAITQLVHMTTPALKRYPKVKIFLGNVIGKRSSTRNEKTFYDPA